MMSEKRARKRKKSDFISFTILYILFFTSCMFFSACSSSSTSSIFSSSLKKSVCPYEIEDLEIKNCEESSANFTDSLCFVFVNLSEKTVKKLTVTFSISYPEKEFFSENRFYRTVEAEVFPFASEEIQIPLDDYLEECSIKMEDIENECTCETESVFISGISYTDGTSWRDVYGAYAHW